MLFQVAARNSREGKIGKHSGLKQHRTVLLQRLDYIKKLDYRIKKCQDKKEKLGQFLESCLQTTYLANLYKNHLNNTNLPVQTTCCIKQ